MTTRYMTMAVIAATLVHAVPVAAAAEAAPSASPGAESPSAAPPVRSDVTELIATMQCEIDRLRVEASEQKARVAAVEAGIADEQERRVQQAEDALARRGDLVSTASRLLEIERTLATGSGDVSDDLLHAQATAASVAARASAAGSSLESVLASEGKSVLERSRRALSNGDLFQTRSGVQRAIAALRAAAAANPGVPS